MPHQPDPVRTIKDIGNRQQPDGEPDRPMVWQRKSGLLIGFKD